MGVLTIPDDWQPTAANINALPEPLRRYIMHVETLCDPQWIIRENWRLEWEHSLMAAKVEQLLTKEEQDADESSAIRT